MARVLQLINRRGGDSLNVAVRGWLTDKEGAMKRLAIIGLAILLALLITGGVQAAPIELQYAQGQETDMTAPHLEITGASYDLGTGGFWDEFPTTLEATRVMRLVAESDVSDLDHVEFVIRPDGEEMWGLIDADLSVSENGLIWELGAWDLRLYDCGWYEVAAVGVDQAGNVDQWPGIIRVYSRHDVVALPAVHEPLRLVTAAPSVTRGETTLCFDAPSSRAGAIEVFDISGRQIGEVAFPAGVERVLWTGRSERGTSLPAGVYFARLKDSSSSSTARVVLTR